MKTRIYAAAAVKGLRHIRYNCYILVGCRADYRAQSRDFRVCRRVGRGL